MTVSNKINRRPFVAALLAQRNGALVIPGLGSPTWDCSAAGDSPEYLYSWGGMGLAVPTALGLALAQPQRRVLALTGDGEMLMGIGSLATIGVQQPKNLTVAVIDNERYGETGMQATHTAHGVDMAAVAKACGFLNSRIILKNTSLQKIVHETPGPNFLQIKVAAEKLPLVLPPHDGVHLKERFRKALADVLPKKR